MPKLSQRLINATKPNPGRDIILWDTKLPRFGFRVRSWGKRTYILKYRSPTGQQRKLTIGTPEVIDLHQARQIAREQLREVDQGHDPAIQPQSADASSTMVDLCSRYMSDYAEARKKPKSIRGDRAMIDKVILPALGSLTTAEVSRTDISQLHTSLRSTPYRANRVLALLSKIFNMAEAWGLRGDATNPTRHVPKYPEQKRQRYLSEVELTRLGENLAAAEQSGSLAPQIIAAFHRCVVAPPGGAVPLVWSLLRLQGFKVRNSSSISTVSMALRLPSFKPARS